nr:hypothetical protein [Cressdnaviricota sp.]
MPKHARTGKTSPRADFCNATRGISSDGDAETSSNHIGSDGPDGSENRRTNGGCNESNGLLYFYEETTTIKRLSFYK